ncbi:DUF5060 domain-containing protein [Paenibacillus hamazuiensis]|uniref:DUF5060 domain-containing protein n=1 Tax=Paenibacillus hamazuiensis TaxID=2936508 RepID=UPI00200FA8D5|nr:DUF5060 domain-containing protein [Paenibacillus hamazuiensis]
MNGGNADYGEKQTEVERWGRFEIGFRGPEEGNPFREVSFRAAFRHGNRVVEADGFYDGGGVYKLRFMPDAEGEWSFVTYSSCHELGGLRGSFRVIPPGPANHGPIRVKDTYRFEYEDGTPYLPFGTTLYHWFHHGSEEEERQTLETLAASPFNKARMCVLPTGAMDPPMLAFAGNRTGGHDVSRFNPDFFAHLERRIEDLQRLGIEADVILFHPYDQEVWGFEQMEPETEEAYLRYVIARLSAYRNVWWSIANEYDFNKHKTVADWDRLLRFVQARDPYGRLRSIHNGTKMYDYERTSTYDFSKPWITHQSVQHWEPGLTASWLKTHRKPLVLDEMCYEGNAPRRWGNISGEELVRRFWETMVQGGYASHGEVFFEKSDWISKGGRLIGDSPQRIAFLRKLMEQGLPDVWRPEGERELFWHYFGISRPSSWELKLPEGKAYAVDLVDTWEMTVERLTWLAKGECSIGLPGKSYMALRLRQVQ